MQLSDGGDGVCQTMLNVFGECCCLMVVCVCQTYVNVFGECSCLMVVVCVRHYVKCVW